MSGECPIYGCGANRGAGKLLCSKHWRALPKVQQRDVWQTYHGMLQAMRGNQTNAVTNAIQAYRQARDAAIDTVNRRESPLCA